MSHELSRGKARGKILYTLIPLLLFQISAIPRFCTPKYLCGLLLGSNQKLNKGLKVLVGMRNFKILRKILKFSTSNARNGYLKNLNLEWKMTQYNKFIFESNNFLFHYKIRSIIKFCSGVLTMKRKVKRTSRRRDLYNQGNLTLQAGKRKLFWVWARCKIAEMA